MKYDHILKIKSTDNLISEILGIISYDFLEKFNKNRYCELEINENVLPSVYRTKNYKYVHTTKI